MKTIKIQFQKDDSIELNITKKILPDYRIDQLLDLSLGIGCLFSHLACSQASEKNPGLSGVEWWGIYQVSELQIRLQQEIRNRVPSEITDSLDEQLTEEGN
jgi:hypothetical protein